ncbi:MAG: bacillithiol biosynthesis deacetylase BshB1 [Bacteroidota bacterium]|nr:bacillithiol biosynthesis deacetylase BshB1 [Bacteroidota bacterium]
MKLDILVFSAHPDDAEVGCGGTILKQVALGDKVGMIDLTRGELGTRGSAEIRAQEALEAKRLLGLQVRENLWMRDCFFVIDEVHTMQIIRMVRKYQPRIVLANAPHDRHPDHGRACKLVTEAAFIAGLPQIKTELDGEPQEAWRPELVLQYIQNTYIKPDILVDITNYWDLKLAAIQAYRSQFYHPDYNEPTVTYISAPDFFLIHEGRAREFGKYINAPFAEGFTCQRFLGVDNLQHLR